jgi:archaetidylinositol phosphate synthase
MSTAFEIQTGGAPKIENHQSAFVNAVRVHNALTAKVEKRLLNWIAQRLPAAIHPDHLTGLALAAQILAGAGYALASHDVLALWLVNFFLVLNWFGDSLDGTVARIRNQQRPRYGFYVDHIADALGALALMAGLGCSGYLHWQIAAGMLVGFYALSIESYLATYTIGRFHLSHGMFGPTEIRIALIAGNAFVCAHPNVNIANRHFLLFDVGGAVAIAGMAVMFLSVSVRHTTLLYRQEPVR